MVQGVTLVARFVDSSLDMANHTGYEMTLDGAEELDQDMATRHAYAADRRTGADDTRLVATLCRTARDHGMSARAVYDSRRDCPDAHGSWHVLVTAPDGGVLATRSARRLMAWLGY